MAIDINSVIPQKLAFESQTFLGVQMRELIYSKGLNFGSLEVKVSEYLESLEKLGLADPAYRKNMATELAWRLWVGDTADMSMKMFAFGLKVLGYEKFHLSLRLEKDMHSIPDAITGSIDLVEDRTVG